MKKRTKIILIVLSVLIACGFYGSYNFKEDRAVAREILTPSFNGDVQGTLKKVKEVDYFTNPLINFKYQSFKKGFLARFASKTETIENNFGSETVYDIANIYRKYWGTELLKADQSKKTDTLLYQELINYLIQNNLTNIGKDSLESSIKNDVELTKLLKQEGFQSKFLFKNGFQDLLIWKEERIEQETVELPNGTLEVDVINLDNVLLTGYDGYASWDIHTIGGWAISESPTIYCLSSGWSTSSENYKVTFLKHECIHYEDLIKYPNLSSTDLEYRAKLVELMYSTEESIYGRIAVYLNGASSKDRSYSHPYAEHCIVRDLSKELFQKGYENDYNKWLQIDVQRINETATKLFRSNEAKLKEDKSLKELI